MSDIKYSYYQTSKGYKIVNGTSAQFLKADGSIDSNSYATQSWVTSQGYLTSDSLNNYVTTNTPQTINASKTFIGNTFVQSRFAVKGNDGNDWIVLHGGVNKGVIKNPEGTSNEVTFIGWWRSTNSPNLGNFPYFGFDHSSARVVIRTNLAQHTDKALAVAGPSYIESISTQSHGDSSQWKQAHNWGDHAAAGYLTSASLSGYATESWANSKFLPLIGGTLTGPLNINANQGLSIDYPNGMSYGNGYYAKFYAGSLDKTGISWHIPSAGKVDVSVRSKYSFGILNHLVSDLTVNDNVVWHEGNFNPANYVLYTTLSNNYVTKNGVQDINATKTFTVSPIVPTPTLGNHAVNKSWVEGQGYINAGLHIDVSDEGGELRINPIEIFIDGTTSKNFDGARNKHRLVYIILSDGASGLSLENLQPKQRIVIFNISGKTISINEVGTSSAYNFDHGYKVSVYKTQNSYYSANSAIFYDKTELAIW